MRAKVARSKIATLHSPLVSVAAGYQVSMRSLVTEVMYSSRERNATKRISVVFPSILAIISVSLFVFFFFAEFSEFSFCRVDDVISSLIFVCKSKSLSRVALKQKPTTIRQSVIGSDNLLLLLFYFFSSCSLLFLRTVSSCERSDSTITASLRWIVCPLRGFLYFSCSASVKTGAGHVYLP